MTNRSSTRLLPLLAALLVALISPPGAPAVAALGGHGGAGPYFHIVRSAALSGCGAPQCAFAPQRNPRSIQAIAPSTSQSPPAHRLVRNTATDRIVNTAADLASPCTTIVKNVVQESLRCAIADANADGSGDTITFNIPSNASGCTNSVCVISPTSPLPALAASSTTIDGYSQPGSHPNTAALPADNAIIHIELNGVTAGNTATGLHITGSTNTIRGLSIVNFGTQPANESAIHIDGGSGDVVKGNFIGILPNGSTAGPNFAGILADNGATSITIGISNPADANLIGANNGDGVKVVGSGSASTATIEGNSIGLAADGSTARGNSNAGVRVQKVNDPNAHPAVADVIDWNFIENNIIGAAIGVDSNDEDTRAELTRNIIYGNAGLGIDVAPFATVNCNHGLNSGPNLAIQCPQINSASTRLISGYVPCPGCLVEVYVAMDGANDAHYGQASAYLGTATVDSHGQWSLAAPFATKLLKGQSVTATATEPASQTTPVTSEFGLDVTVTGGTALTVTTTQDLTGPCSSNQYSLRCAITQANADGHDDDIDFNIPSSDSGCKNSICTIKLGSSQLPPLTATNTVIDGYSQPGARPNDFPSGDDAVITIVLDGGNGGFDGIDIYAGNDAVQGLGFMGFSGGSIGAAAIHFLYSASAGGQALGNFIGVKPDGFSDAYSYYGVLVDSGAHNIQIGGSDPADRNLISGGDAGIYLHGSRNNTVQGNYVGFNLNIDSGFNLYGIKMTGEGVAGDPSSGDLIGGTDAVERNVVSSILGDGIYAEPTPGDTAGATNIYGAITGNYIGTAPTGQQAMRSDTTGHGIALHSAQHFTVSNNLIAGNFAGLLLAGPGGKNNLVTGNTFGIGAFGQLIPNQSNNIDVSYDEQDLIKNNTIANSPGAGIFLGPGTNDTPHTQISQNSFFNNGQGIVLWGQQANSCFYPGSIGHPNDYTPCAVIKSATTDRVTGEACSGCTVEVFITPGSTDDEGKTYLGSATAPPCAGATCTGFTAWTLPAGYYATALPRGVYLTTTVTTPQSGATPPETSEFSPWPALVGSRLTVTTAADKSVPCASASAYSLRCAITQANADGGGDAIFFAIPSSDPGCKAGKGCILALTSTLPAITAPWTGVLGSTQPGTKPNTSSLGGSSAGNNASPALQLNRARLRNAPDGIVVTAAHVVVDGLQVGGFSGAGVHFSGPNAQTDILTGDFLGIARDGKTTAANNSGVLLDGGAGGALIGLLTPADTNLLSDNTSYGIEMHDGSGNTVIGNAIGADHTIKAAAANGYAGILLLTTDATTIGIPGAPFANVIAGNFNDGIDGLGATNTAIVNNRIGNTYWLTTALPNGGSGIYLYSGHDNTIGGTDDSSANVIGGNSGDGVDLLGETGDTVQHNIIGKGTSLGQPNSGIGILIADASDSVALKGRPYLRVPRTPIGGGHHIMAGTIANNTIMNNAGVGIQIGLSKYEYEDHVLVSQNNMAANSFGIFNPGFSYNTPNGIKLSCTTLIKPRGPNDDLSCPTVTGATTSSVTVKGACFNCTVEIFAASTDPKDRNISEGARYLFSFVATGFGPTWTVQAPPGVITSGMALTAVNISPPAAHPSESSEFGPIKRVSRH